jgi:hypothetical protein
MSLTPEGRTKQKLLRFINSLEPVPYVFFPATHGYGRSGIPDVVGCWRGRFFAIECKAAGKLNSTTALQNRELEMIRTAEGIAFAYDGTMTDEELLIRLLGGLQGDDA